ncbi:MAG: FMN-binding negative transcriptional regulator [Sciscionella sp.]
MTDEVARPEMYVPAHYAAPDARTLILQYPFANVVTMGGTTPFATSTPLVFETDASDERRLVGHVALRNPHAERLLEAQPVLAIFNGPSGYISPRWYVDKPQVPTWNYLAAQLRGELQPILDLEGARAVLVRLITVMERGAEAPWRLEDAVEGTTERLLPRIRAFRIHIGPLQAAAKLSQAHPPTDRLRVIRGLLSESDADGRELARIMARAYTPDT